MKTVNITVYGNIAVYRNIALSVYKIDYTLRCLEYMCSLAPLCLLSVKTHMYSNYYTSMFSENL